MSDVSTTTVDTRRAWEIVLQRIESDLIAGALGPGDHLPPERTLAAELGVGRSSVREAFRVLEVLGLIRTQTGSGPQSGAIIVARPNGGMSALMRLQVAARGFDVGDVVKTRLVLEAAVVTELASTSNPDLRAAIELLDAMDRGGSPASAGTAPEEDLTEAEFLSLDAAFHVALAVASGNDVIAAMMTGLRNSVESYVLAGAPFLPSWTSTCARLRHEHRGIIDAILDNDVELARERVSSHINTYYEETNFLGDRVPANGVPTNQVSGHPTLAT